MQAKEFRDRINQMLLNRYNWVLSKHKLDQVTICVFDTITEVLKEEPLVIESFGTFGVEKMRAKKLRTPLTEKICPGGEVDCPALVYPTFRFHKKLRHEVRHHYDVTGKIHDVISNKERKENIKNENQK